jgi:purine nucleoside phosphorylase
VTEFAIICGSAGLEIAAGFAPVTCPRSRYGVPSETPRVGSIEGVEVLVLARHGVPHRLAPHLVNYRANLDVLSQLGVRRVLALNTVGGIHPGAAPGAIVMPHQIVDYTWGREHTYADAADLLHVEFSDPFDPGMRQRMLAAGSAAGIELVDGGVYGCTQGPRFETAAEIDRMDRDGCTLVGMTAMPEAALAREKGLAYGSLALVVNPAAGRAENAIDLEAIAEVSREGMRRVEQLLRVFLQREVGVY